MSQSQPISIGLSQSISIQIAASKLVVDTRNATKDLQEFKNKIIKLGAGNNVASFPQHPDDHEKAAISLVTH